MIWKIRREQYPYTTRILTQIDFATDARTAIVVHTVKRTSGKARNQKDREWFNYCDEITDISRKLFNTVQYCKTSLSL